MLRPRGRKEEQRRLLPLGSSRRGLNASIRDQEWMAGTCSRHINVPPPPLERRSSKRLKWSESSAKTLPRKASPALLKSGIKGRQTVDRLAGSEETQVEGVKRPTRTQRRPPSSARPSGNSAKKHFGWILFATVSLLPALTYEL